MFPSPSTSTPFSVKDILNLEHSHGVMVSPLDASSPMECCAVSTSSSSSFASSCMLARLKQEPLRDLSSTAAASMFGEEIQESRGSTLGFAATFYGKSLLEMDRAKDGKSDTFEGKNRKGEFDLFFFIFFAGHVQKDAPNKLKALLIKRHRSRFVENLPLNNSM